MKRGLFITFEGTEGGGKSTQIELLARRLRESGEVVRQLREPGGTPLGEAIRELLKHSPAGRGMSPSAELLLVNASRAQLVHSVIQPALQAGEVVLCDRFTDSTTAYQGYGRGLALDQVNNAILAATDGLQPDLTLLLRVPVEVSEQRRLQRAGVADRFEESDREFFQRVGRGFDEIARENPGRVRVIDATGSIEAVHASIWQVVGPLTGARS